MTKVTIYHNPSCSKSRQTLALLAENGIDATVIHYLETPPNEATLRNIVHLLGVSAIEIIRTGEKEFKEEMHNWSEEQLVQAINEHPILMQRPIVVANDQARIGRPPEAVLEIL
jgi:arsenate reductase